MEGHCSKDLSCLHIEVKSIEAESNGNLRMAKFPHLNINLELALLCLTLSSTTWTITYPFCNFRVGTDSRTCPWCYWEDDEICVKTICGPPPHCMQVSLSWLAFTIHQSLRWELEDLGFHASVATHYMCAKSKETSWTSEFSL